jgi:hypothetical protein
MGNSTSSELNGSDGRDPAIGVTKQIQERNDWCCSFSPNYEGRRPDLSRDERMKAASHSLHRAAVHGILHEIEPNVKAWADSPEMINRVDPQGDTALHKASQNDHLEICKLLCKVNFSMYNMCLTSRCLLSMIDQYGASITIRNKAALTAEEAACRYNAIRCINFLKAYSAAPELHRAAMVNDISTISRILEGEPEQVNSVDESGSSALHLAASCGYALTCRALCEVRCLRTNAYPYP